MASNKTDERTDKEPAKEDPTTTDQLKAVEYSHSSNLPEILEQLNLSLLISTYQAGQLIVVGAWRGQLTFSFHRFDQIMGVAVGADRLAVGTRRQITFLTSAHNLAPSIEPAGSHDSCWLSRLSFVTGSIQVHDLAWGSEGLWAVNTLFSCLCTFSSEYNFVPRWRPPFISQLIDQDRCHLNGLAMENGQPRFVTVLGETDQPAGWRENKVSGGALLEVPTGRVVARGLCMPHSPRVVDGRLWVLNSGLGQLAQVDRQTGQYRAVADLPGYTRGLSFAGGLAFVGLSRIRETNIFGGLPIGNDLEALKCGVGVVELATGRTLATLQFLSGVEEIFAVECIQGSRNPKLCGPNLSEDGEKEIWVVPAESPMRSDSPKSDSPPPDSRPQQPQQTNQSAPDEQFYSGVQAARARVADWILGGTQAHQQGRLEEALQLFRQAVTAQPESAEVHNLMGNLLQDLHQQAQAIACYRQAVKLDPNYAPAHQNLGVLCAADNRPLEALKHYELAQKIRPTAMNMVLGATMLPIIYDSKEQVDYWRQRLEHRVAELADSGVVIETAESMIPSSFNFAYHGRNDRHVMQNLARVYRGVQCCPAAQSGTWQPKRKRPRVGFLSAHFCNHTIGRLNVGMVEQLSKSKFEIVVVALRHQDDDFTRRFQRAAETYVSVPRSPAAARTMIAELDLDILIFADVGMDALTQTLCYSRMAPIQAVTWGHPDTTGSPAIDYFISSDLAEIPEADRHYTERLVRLPTMGVFYERPAGGPVERSRESFGLDSSRNCYLCPQTLFKFHPDFDEVLSGILQADPDAQIAVIEGRVLTWTQSLKDRWRRTLGEEGLSRVRFLPAVPQAEFLQLLSLGDVMLDPYPFGGGNTTYEALAMGTPVVTRAVEFLRGRLAIGLYHRMGFTDLIVQSPEEYVSLSVRLARDNQYRASIRKAIQESRGVLYENTDDVAAYTQMLDQLIAGGPS
jgi:protein O-GlcNAc transferase